MTLPRDSSSVGEPCWPVRPVRPVRPDPFRTPYHWICTALAGTALLFSLRMRSYEYTLTGRHFFVGNLGMGARRTVCGCVGFLLVDASHGRIKHSTTCKSMSHRACRSPSFRPCDPVRRQIQIKIKIEKRLSLYGQGYHRLTPASLANTTSVTRKKPVGLASRWPAAGRWPPAARQTTCQTPAFQMRSSTSFPRTGPKSYR